jgi:hypothetical protein
MRTKRVLICLGIVTMTTPALCVQFYIVQEVRDAPMNVTETLLTESYDSLAIPLHIPAYSKPIPTNATEYRRRQYVSPRSRHWIKSKTRSGAAERDAAQDWRRRSKAGGRLFTSFNLD